ARPAHTTLTAYASHSFPAEPADHADLHASPTRRSSDLNNPVPDTTLPTVSLTAPAAGATVSGTVTVSANATDNVGVVGVQFKLEVGRVGAGDTVTLHASSWTTTSTSAGAHTLTAVARDA